ncbi:hypothetical protein SEA_BIG4_271 [Microbacterium phage Big4]|nr:hypothetical protein SEA_BIG4_271 [Microbacterium phage Big4]
MEKRSENHIVSTFSPEGYIIFRLQQIAEDRHEPMHRRERARKWYDHLTKADSPSCYPIVSQSGGRRRTKGDRAEFATETMYHGSYKQPEPERYA